MELFSRGNHDDPHADDPVEITPRMLREIICAALDERARIDIEVHADHHRWIEAQIAAEERRTEMYAEIRKTAIQWSVGAMLSGLAGWLGFKVMGGGG